MGHLPSKFSKMKDRPNRANLNAYVPQSSDAVNKIKDQIDGQGIPPVLSIKTGRTLGKAPIASNNRSGVSSAAKKMNTYRNMDVY